MWQWCTLDVLCVVVPTMKTVTPSLCALEESLLMFLQCSGESFFCEIISSWLHSLDYLGNCVALIVSSFFHKSWRTVQVFWPLSSLWGTNNAVFF